MLATVPSQVTVYDLHRATQQRAQGVQHEANEIILDRCYARIKRMNRMRQTSCTFVVPRLLFGRPLFDADACSAFIMRNLTGNGFYVTCPPHNATLLYVSWDLRRPPRTTTTAGCRGGIAHKPGFPGYAGFPDPSFLRSRSPSPSPSPPPCPAPAPAPARVPVPAPVPAPPPVSPPPRGMRVVRQAPADEFSFSKPFDFTAPHPTPPPPPTVSPPSAAASSSVRQPSPMAPPFPGTGTRRFGGGGRGGGEAASKVGPVRSPSLFERSIRQFKPSGKFSLAL